MKIKITEAETAELIKRSYGRGVLELTFGANGGDLTDSPINEWVIKELADMRKKP